MAAMSPRDYPATEPTLPPAVRRDRGPLVTVVVPAFNAERTLAPTLRSVAAQDHRNLEILIVDDGSTDQTARVALDFCSIEPRARLLRKPNGGVASARNHGLAQARGEFVAPIDADDLWHPAKISRQLAAALQAPGTGFVYCWFRDIDSAGRVWRDGPALSVRGRALQWLAYFNFVGNGSAPLFSRSALQAIGGYDERLRRLGAEGCEDLLAQLAVAKRYGVAVVPEYLVGYRLTAGAMSGDPDRMHRSWRHALELLGGEPPLLRRAVRRSEGARLLLLAEAAAWRGAPAAAVRLLWSAARLDPARTGLHLLCRTVRSVARRLHAARADRRRFDALAPTAESPASDPWLRRLARFDQRRLDAMAVLEHPEPSIRCGEVALSAR
jgi:hypothetical protein